MTPKKILLIVAACLSYAITQAQQTSFSVGLNSGLFNYGGREALESGSLILNPEPRSFPHGGPPGTDHAFSFEVTTRLQYASRKKILLGAELAYQSLQSKSDIGFTHFTMFSSFFIASQGTIKTESRFLCFTPFAGYRILDRKVRMDLTSGLEMAASLSRREKIDAELTETNEKIDVTNKADNNRSDFRLRVHLVTSIKRVGFTAGYAWGMTNYYKNTEPYRSAAYSKFLRLGLSYTL